MKIYVVGGFCRDTILGKTPKDHDFVICGAQPQDLTSLNFRQVGSDFPVFLHPITRDEFALARQERKVGNGYHGFEINYAPSVTLEEDLHRRDLTCNSIAIEIDPIILTTGEFKTIGGFIDPFHGIQDLENGILRHVSNAFKDDPVRILRIARFKARYHTEFGFQISASTMDLMSEMVENGEVDFLVPERVWAETEKALMEDSPARFFCELQKCDALKRIMPLFDNMSAIVSPVFNAAIVRNMDLDTRMMTFTSTMDVTHLRDALLALHVPNDLVRRCVKFNKLRTGIEWMTKEDATTPIKRVWIFKLLNDMDAWKNPNELRNMGIALSLVSNPNINEVFDLMISCLQSGNAACFNKLTDDQKATLKGKEISEAISDMRWDIVKMIVS